MSSESPIMLAIEASQRTAGVALRDRAGAAHVEMLSQVKRHDDDLMPAIDRLFLRAKLTPKDLRNGGAVAMSIGPGGFTGLRIAVSTAKMLAEVLGASVIAVPSALVAVESLPENVQEALVALACKGESCWITRLRKDFGLWRIVDQPGLSSPDTLNLAKVEALVADEFLPDAIRARCAQEAVPVVEPTFSPLACLAIGEQMLQRGEIIDPLKLSPLYPREPEAVTLWEKKLKR